MNYLDAVILLIVIFLCYAPVSVDAFVKKARMEQQQKLAFLFFS